jgi:hypothetical protein
MGGAAAHALDKVANKRHVAVGAHLARPPATSGCGPSWPGPSRQGPLVS